MLGQKKVESVEENRDFWPFNTSWAVVEHNCVTNNKILILYVHHSNASSEALRGPKTNNFFILLSFFLHIDSKQFGNQCFKINNEQKTKKLGLNLCNLLIFDLNFY